MKLITAYERASAHSGGDEKLAHAWGHAPAAAAWYGVGSKPEDLVSVTSLASCQHTRRRQQAHSHAAQEHTLFTSLSIKHVLQKCGSDREKPRPSPLRSFNSPRAQPAPSGRLLIHSYSLLSFALQEEGNCCLEKEREWDTLGPVDAPNLKIINVILIPSCIVINLFLPPVAVTPNYKGRASFSEPCVCEFAHLCEQKGDGGWLISCKCDDWRLRAWFLIAHVIEFNQQRYCEIKPLDLWSGVMMYKFGRRGSHIKWINYVQIFELAIITQVV